MMVGDMLGAAARSASGFAIWLEQHHPELAKRCRTESGEADLGRWLRATVSWFELHASGEDWADLTSRLRRSDTPGEALLMTMVERRLAKQGA